jgi:hypothetical protein
MSPAKKCNEQVVTAAEVEARWRAVQAGAGFAVEDTVGRMKPGPLIMVGLGLAALAGACWLHRPSRAATAVSEASDPSAAAPEPAPGRADPLTLSAAAAGVPVQDLDMVRQAVVRGLVEGLIASGVIPGSCRGTKTEAAPDA